MSDTPPAPGGSEDVFSSSGSRPLPPPLAGPPPVVEPPDAALSDPAVPWISIWTRPRATMRRILATDPRSHVFWLAALGGIAGGLKFSTTPDFGDVYPPLVVLAVDLLGGALGGVLTLFILAALVRLAGRWLGGRGGTVEVMAALAWSNVPAIWGLVLWLPRAALLGDQVFQSSPSIVDGNPPAALFFALLNLAQGLIGFWGFIVTLKCIGEAHGFSSWRAFWTVLLAGLLMAVPAGMLLLALQAMK